MRVKQKRETDGMFLLYVVHTKANTCSINDMNLRMYLIALKPLKKTTIQFKGIYDIRKMYFWLSKIYLIYLNEEVSEMFDCQLVIICK